MARRKRFLAFLLCSYLFCLVSSLLAESFRNPILIPTPGDPQGVATADFNGDGKLDLVYTTGLNYPGQTLHVLLGRGDGTFSPSATIALPEYVCGCYINVADVTSDGKLDIVLGGGTGTAAGQIVVLPGQGDGTFGAAVASVLPLNAAAYAVITTRMGIGDLNGDGAADLVVADVANGAIYVLRGNNQGGFTYAYSLGSELYVKSILMLDLNGDGHLDLVATPRGDGSQTLVFLGKGDGTFSSPAVYSVGISPFGVVLADMDGDGHPDLVACLYNGVLTVLPGKADGTFGAVVTLAQTVAPSNVLLEAADYTGARLPDLVVLSAPGVSVLPNTGALAYANPLASMAGPGTPVSTAAGDFNGDGRRDIAMGVEGGIAVLLGKGDGTFISADLYDLGEPVGTTAIADFNGDHKPDIAVSLSADIPRLLLGDGAGHFTLGPDPNTSYGDSRPGSLAAADFNGDGHVDLSEALGTPNSPEVFFGNGQGGFSAPSTVPAGSTALADFNGDGRADMILVDGIAGTITTSLGQVNQTFTEVVTQLRNPEGAALRGIGDVNGDGKPDVMISDYNGFEVWLGNGDGSFTFSNTIPPGYGIGSTNAEVGAVGDIDGDGKPDLVVLSATETGPLTAILWGNGDGTFSAPLPLSLARGYSQVALADVNGDGRLDLVLSDGICIAVVETLPGRIFAPEDDYLAGSSIAYFSLADINGDGYPDLVAADNTGTTVAVLLNQPNGIPPGGPHVIGKLTVAPEPAPFGQSAVATLTLTPEMAGATPSGNVSFLVDDVLAGTVALSSGAASFSLSSALSSGTHTVAAAYAGDGRYAPATYSITHTVQAQVYTTHTVLSATPPTALASETVRLLATVTSTGPVVVGIVTFFDGSQSIGSAAIDAFQHALLDTALLQPGTHSITATYVGRNNPPVETYEPSTSAAATVTISSLATVTTLQASASSITTGALVTLTAQVTSPAALPFGGVSFYDGATLLGTAALLPGLGNVAQATYSTGSLAAGAHTLNATFNANATLGASSGSTGVQVSAAALALVPSMTQPSLSRGSASGATLAATVLQGNGSLPRTHSGVVTFLDGGAVLGQAPVGADGSALLQIPAVSAGAHTLFASFAGLPASSAQAAMSPSTSLPLTTRRSLTGVGLTLSAPYARLVLPAEGAQLLLQAAGPAGAAIALSCPNAAVAGVVCSFAPTALSGSGTVRLTLLPARQQTLAHLGSSRFAPHSSSLPPSTDVAGKHPFPVLAVVFAFFSLRRTQRSKRLLGSMAALLCCCAAVGAISGCTATQTTKSLPGAGVLLIQASTGTGTTELLQTVQLVVVHQ